jgi:glutamate carboxypeptidase
VQPLLDLLRELVELESPTGDTAAVRDRLAAELEALGATVAVEGAHLRADLPGAGPPLLLLGHFDTVWPRGTLETMPWRVEDGRAYGPGSHDMKGGLVVILEAIRRTQTEHALRIAFTADEEIGSPTARDLLAAAADGAAAAFVCEPPTGAGNLKTARKGLGRFRISVTGKAAHAAAAADGVSAIQELALQVLRLHALNDPARGVTVNVGVVAGGTRENVVAAHAEALVDVRVVKAEDCTRLDELLALGPELDGATVELTGGWTRPPLERSPGAAALFEQARAHGLALGLDLREAGVVAGGSDGNLVGALGVPVLDGLGARGGGAHAVDEHVVVDSLDTRAELLARILRTPGV